MRTVFLFHKTFFRLVTLRFRTIYHQLTAHLYVQDRDKFSEPGLSDETAKFSSSTVPQLMQVISPIIKRHCPPAWTRSFLSVFLFFLSCLRIEHEYICVTRLLFTPSRNYYGVCFVLICSDTKIHLLTHWGSRNNL